MKKRTKLFLLAGFLLIGLFCRAQTSVIWCTVGQHVHTGEPTVGDTVNVGDDICLDTNVTSFVVTVYFKGVTSERRMSVNCHCPLPALSSGTVVFCSEIISEPKEGVHVRLPARKFYVK